MEFPNEIFVGTLSSNDSQKVQNIAARIVTGAKQLDHNTPVLKTLHRLPAKYCVDFKILLLTYKAIHGLAPDYLSELLVPYTPLRNLRSGSKQERGFTRSRLSNAC
jgi:hypothetical protein